MINANSALHHGIKAKTIGNKIEYANIELPLFLEK